MNTFERFYNDYLAWQAKLVIGFVALFVFGGMVVGWWVGVSRYLEYQKIDGPQAVELHAFSSHEFGNDHTTSALRDCRALVSLNTGKASFFVYSNEPAARPEVGIGTASSYCSRALSGIENWSRHQVSAPMGLGEKFLWFVLFGVAGLLGLGVALSVAQFAGGILSSEKHPGFSSLLTILIVLWFALSFIIFMSAGLDARRDAWSTTEGQVEVSRLWVTKDGLVLNRPTHMLDWAWEGGILRDASSSVPDELLRDFLEKEGVEPWRSQSIAAQDDGAGVVSEVSGDQPVPSCDALLQGEMDARSDCSSGKLQACREIQHWIRSRLMEGCSGRPSQPEEQEVRSEGTHDSKGLLAPQATGADSAERKLIDGNNAKRSLPVAEPDAEARLVSGGAPRYPSREAREGIGGTVELTVRIDSSGNVIDAAVRTSSRNENLDKAAIDAARTWKFSPSRSGGTAAGATLVVPVKFTPPGENEQFVADAGPAAGRQPDGPAVVSQSDDVSTPPDTSKTRDRSEAPVSPSFVCGSGMLPSESAICSDSSLARMDRKLADEYARALGRSSDASNDSRSSNIKSEQRRWMQRRNVSCGADKECLRASMENRIYELRAY